MSKCHIVGHLIHWLKLYPVSFTTVSESDMKPFPDRCIWIPSHVLQCHTCEEKEIHSIEIPYPCLYGKRLPPSLRVKTRLDTLKVQIYPYRPSKSKYLVSQGNLPIMHSFQKMALVHKQFINTYDIPHLSSRSDMTVIQSEDKIVWCLHALSV